MQIPWQFKYRKGTTKYILKKSLEPVLPKNIVYRPKKGFGIPIGKWLKQNMLVVIPKNGKLNKLNPSFIQKRLDEHRDNRSDQRAFLWNQWMLDMFT